MNRRIAKLIKIGLFALPLGWTSVALAQGNTNVPGDTGVNPMPKDNAPLEFDNSAGRTPEQKKAGASDNLGTVDQNDIGKTSGSDVNKDSDLYKGSTQDTQKKSDTDTLKGSDQDQFNKTGGSDLNTDTSKSTDVNKGGSYNLGGSTDIQKQSGTDSDLNNDSKLKTDTDLGSDTSMNKSDEDALKGTDSQKKHRKGRKSTTIRQKKTETFEEGQPIQKSKSETPKSDTDLNQ